jgi:hypothetical protein
VHIFEDIAAGLLTISFSMHTGGVPLMATATKSKDKSKLKLQPLGDRIVVRREVSEDMAKIIAFDQEAREAIRRGVSKLARAVKVTLGTQGTQRHSCRRALAAQP